MNALSPNIETDYAGRERAGPADFCKLWAYLTQEKKTPCTGFISGLSSALQIHRTK
jgi:hypothetical protein